MYAFRAKLARRGAANRVKLFDILLLEGSNVHMIQPINQKTLWIYFQHISDAERIRSVLSEYNATQIIEKEIR